MRSRYQWAVAACAVVTVVSCVRAGDLTSGIPVGEAVGSYVTTKCGGLDDGVQMGQSLCYTWRLGGRPVVFAFAKTPSDSLAGLAKQLDKLVAENEAKRLAVVINFVGEPNEETKAKIAEFGTKHNLQHIALTVTADAPKFKVNEQAELTVMHYKDKSVKSNQAIGPNGLDAAAVKRIIEGVATILD